MSNGVPWVTLFEQRLREGTGLEIGPTEPLVESIENHKQAFPRFSGPTFHLFLQPGPRPQRLTAAEKSECELVFGSIVPIQSHFRHTRVRNDGIDPHRTNTVAGKELVSGLIYALTRAGRTRGDWFSMFGSRCFHTREVY